MQTLSLCVNILLHYFIDFEISKVKKKKKNKIGVVHF